MVANGLGYGSAMTLARIGCCPTVLVFLSFTMTTPNIIFGGVFGYLFFVSDYLNGFNFVGTFLFEFSLGDFLTLQQEQHLSL